jgi:hypothetical protein
MKVDPAIDMFLPTHCPEGHLYVLEGVTLICDGCTRNPDNATFETMDKMVDRFAQFIKAEMRVNHHKGMRNVWLARSIDEALMEVHQHVAKLHVAVIHPDEANECGCDLYDKDHEDQNCTGADLRMEHAADVAACCMMLVDLLGLLNPGEERNSLPIPTLRNPRPDY